MRKALVSIIIIVFCISVCSYAICEENVEKSAVLNVVNKYWDAMTGPTKGTMEQVSKDMKSFASLFDFENLKSSASVPILDQMSYQYKQLKSNEQKEAYYFVFAGNFVSGFQKARLGRVSNITRDDFVTGDVVFSDDNKEASVKIKDSKLGTLYTLLLHKKDGSWLIYSWEIKGS